MVRQRGHLRLLERVDEAPDVDVDVEEIPPGSLLAPMRSPEDAVLALLARAVGETMPVEVAANVAAIRAGAWS